MTSDRRTIDHRRHTMRSKPGEHLSQQGVDLARRVGAGEFGAIPRYNLVVTSPTPRAFETAIAMGFAVDEQRDFLWMGEVANDLRWPQWPGDFAQTIRTTRSVARYAEALAEALRAIAARLPSEGAALVVSHGGVVELSAVALLPDINHEAWGSPIGYAEGMRLVFEGDRCASAEPLRVGAKDYLVEN
jgi:broad specificity phosphatase PhoE